MLRCRIRIEGEKELFHNAIIVFSNVNFKLYISHILLATYIKLTFPKRTGSRGDSIKISVAVQIILTPDILESVLIAKDTENQSLHRQLQDVESKLMVRTYESNIDTSNLRAQFEEKCKKVQQLEGQVARLEKVGFIDINNLQLLHIDLRTAERRDAYFVVGFRKPQRHGTP